MILVNLTPHPVVFAGGRTLPRCDNPPRLAEKIEPDGKVDGINVVRKSFDVSGCILPKPDYGTTFYVVPLLIAQAFKGQRNDLLVTDDPLRDEQGRIVACGRLARV